MPSKWSLHSTSCSHTSISAPRHIQATKACILVIASPPKADQVHRVAQTSREQRQAVGRRTHRLGCVTRSRCRFGGGSSGACPARPALCLPDTAQPADRKSSPCPARCRLTAGCARTPATSRLQGRHPWMYLTELSIRSPFLLARQSVSVRRPWSSFSAAIGVGKQTKAGKSHV